MNCLREIGEGRWLTVHSSEREGLQLTGGRGGGCSQVDHTNRVEDSLIAMKEQSLVLPYSESCSQLTFKRAFLS